MITNFGSINIDHVYRVHRLPVAGETIAIRAYERFLGGKGVNQSIAIARSGGEVRHVGAIGPDGAWAARQLELAGLDISRVSTVAEATGHAIVTVDDAGENQILICGGANQCLSRDQIVRELVSGAQDGSWVLLQNETNLATTIVREAKQLGYRIAYSAAPFVADITVSLLREGIDLLAVNESEAAELARACGTTISEVPAGSLLVTKGQSGAEYRRGGKVLQQPAFQVTTVDSTGAGDTFLGAFLARRSCGDSAAEALRYAAAASAIQVTRPGAAAAIPHGREVEAFLSERSG